MYNPSLAVLDTLPSDDASTLDKKAYFKRIAEHCDQYKTPSVIRSITQFLVTVSLFFLACAGLFLSVQNGIWWAYAGLLLPASGLLVKLFIIQHDCGHGSYFKSSRSNDMLGRLISLLTWTPYYYWKRMHNIHHAGSGNLERRGYGAIETVREFKNLSPKDRFKYRLYRNPFLLLGIGTPAFMIIGQRFSMTQPFILPEGAKKLTFSGSSILKSVWGTNIALAVFYGVLGAFIGYITLLTICLPILIITCWAGGWLFYIQHQFEDTHWEDSKTWSYNEAAVMGSSYDDLPKWLQWFTGSIGIHHVHHLNASIPNYRLQTCIDDMPELKKINRMTFRESLVCLKWALWDEQKKKMIPFSRLEKL